MGFEIRNVVPKWITTPFVSLILMLALSVSCDAQTFDKAKLDAFFDRLAEKSQSMGSIVLAKDGKVLFSRAIGYGQIDGNYKKPLTDASRFAIASITKTFTAVMILQLVEEGKLKLTDTLDKFYAQVPNSKKITIGQILAHRSGIPNVIGDRESRRDNNAPVSRDEMLALIVDGKPEFEPNSRAVYSNSGYFVLALVLEKVTGKSFAQAMTERITSKIGLADTYTVTERIDVTKNESLTFWRLGNNWKLGRETHPVIFEIVSTPSDLAKFVEALFDLKLITQKSLDQMKTIRDGEGLGIVSFMFAGRTFYGHTGGGDNYGSWLMYLPDEKLAVSFCTNAKVHPVKDIISGMIDIYYSKPFEIPPFDSLAVSPEILDTYVGIYSSRSSPNKWTVTRDGGSLLARPGTENDAVALEATADDKFQLFSGRVTFEFDAGKKQMTIKRGPMPLVFTKEK